MGYVKKKQRKMVKESAEGKAALKSVEGKSIPDAIATLFGNVINNKVK
jgi:hypothetical protein